MFKLFVRQLLQGTALSTEDIVDVLTLKDNDNSIEDYATALHLLVRVKVKFTLSIKASTSSHIFPRICLKRDVCLPAKPSGVESTSTMSTNFIS